MVNTIQTATLMNTEQHITLEGNTEEKKTQEAVNKRQLFNNIGSFFNGAALALAFSAFALSTPLTLSILTIGLFILGTGIYLINANSDKKQPIVTEEKHVPPEVKEIKKSYFTSILEYLGNYLSPTIHVPGYVEPAAPTEKIDKVKDEITRAPISNRSTILSNSLIDISLDKEKISDKLHKEIVDTLEFSFEKLLPPGGEIRFDKENPNHFTITYDKPYQGTTSKISKGGIPFIKRVTLKANNEVHGHFDKKTGSLILEKNSLGGSIPFLGTKYLNEIKLLVEDEETFKVLIPFPGMTPWNKEEIFKTFEHTLWC